MSLLARRWIRTPSLMMMMMNLRRRRLDPHPRLPPYQQILLTRNNFWELGYRIFKELWNPVPMIARLVAGELRSEIAAAVEAEVRSAMTTTQRTLKLHGDLMQSFNLTLSHKGVSGGCFHKKGLRFQKKTDKGGAGLSRSFMFHCNVSWMNLSIHWMPIIIRQEVWTLDFQLGAHGEEDGEPMSLRPNSGIGNQALCFF